METNNNNNIETNNVTTNTNNSKPKKNRPKHLGNYTCKYCGEKCHNVRKCPKRLAEEKASREA